MDGRARQPGVARAVQLFMMIAGHDIGGAENLRSLRNQLVTKLGVALDDGELSLSEPRGFEQNGFGYILFPTSW